MKTMYVAQVSVNFTSKWRRLFKETARSCSPAGGGVWRMQKISCRREGAVALDPSCRCKHHTSKALLVGTFEKTKCNTGIPCFASVNMRRHRHVYD